MRQRHTDKLQVVGKDKEKVVQTQSILTPVKGTCTY